MIRSGALERHRWVRHAHSDRAHGPVGSAQAPGWREGRDGLVRAAGGAPESLVVPHQVHGARVAAVGPSDRGTVLAATDGLATATPGLPLLVQGADCPLVLLVSDDVPAVAVLHSGWRGTATKISAEGVAAMRSLGAPASGLRAAVFPGIGPCCFEVGPDVVREFDAAFGPAAAAWTRHGRDGTDRSLFDLAPAIRATLVASGVGEDRIDVVTGCTVCGGTLWSHRGSRGGPERHGLVAIVVD